MQNNFAYFKLRKPSAMIQRIICITIVFIDKPQTAFDFLLVGQKLASALADDTFKAAGYYIFLHFLVSSFMP